MHILLTPISYIYCNKGLTSALVQYVVEGSIWHVVANDDGVRGGR